jgi:hypothetical protein
MKLIYFKVNNNNIKKASAHLNADAVNAGRMSADTMTSVRLS